MKESGVNVNIFGSHSTTAASTSKCKAAGLSFKEISNRQGGQPNVLSHYIMTSQLRKIFLRLFFCNFVNSRHIIEYILSVWTYICGIQWVQALQ